MEEALGKKRAPLTTWETRSGNVMERITAFYAFLENV